MTSRPVVVRSWLLALTGALGLGCGESGTGGRAIDFEMALAASPSSAVFSTTTGWSVELIEARIALGPIYLWENAPPVASRGRAPGGWWASVSDWVVPSARAHAGTGHFSGGEVLGEWLEQVGFDALGGRRPLGIVSGTAGTARSFSVWLEPPGSASAREATRGHHAWVTGTATRGEEVVEFEGGLDLPDTASAERVEGVGAELTLDAGRSIVVRIHVERWLAEAHFDRLATEPGAVRSPSGRWTIGERSQVATAWYLGARSAAAFSAALE